MQDIELYARMLGVTSPWVVQDVRLELKQRTVTVMVGYDTRAAEGRLLFTIANYGGGDTWIRCN